MIRADPRQFDMFAAIEPLPVVLPMHPTGWEVAPIAERGEATEAKVKGSYSALSLSTSGKVMRPFLFRAAQWVNTGGCYFRGNADIECYRIVPAAEFAGPGEARTYHDHSFHTEHRANLGAYHGMLAKHGSADVVLIGPPIVLVLKGSGA
jgi:hypothetical protein